MSGAKNDGGPAFPHAAGDFCDGWDGMSLRDRFAIAALAGQVTFEGMDGCDPQHVAGMAYELADAMLAERGKAD